MNTNTTSNKENNLRALNAALFNELHKVQTVNVSEADLNRATTVCKIAKQLLDIRKVEHKERLLKKYLKENIDPTLELPNPNKND